MKNGFGIFNRREKLVTSPVEALPAARTLTPVQMLYALKARRSFSLKLVSPEPLDRSFVETLLDASNWAPSHGHTEPWRFTVFMENGRAQLRDAFAQAYRELTPPEKFSQEGLAAASERVWQAPVWIAIVMQPDLKKPMPEWEEIISTGIAVHNMQLMATSLGLASKWSSGAVATHESVAKFLGVELPARLFGFFYVGYPAGENPRGDRKPLEQKVKWVTE